MELFDNLTHLRGVSVLHTYEVCNTIGQYTPRRCVKGCNGVADIGGIYGKGDNKDIRGIIRLKMSLRE